MKIGLGTALLLIIILILGSMLMLNWGDYESSNDGIVEEMAEDLSILPEDDVRVDNLHDSLADVRVGYEVTGAQLTSYWYEDGQYQIVMLHGPTPDTATIVTSDTINVVGTPTSTLIDWNVEYGGMYAPGNGALGFIVTNNNHGTTCLVWVWEA